MHNTMEVSSQSCMRCGPRALVLWSCDWRGGMSSLKVETQGSGRLPTLALKSPATMMCAGIAAAAAAATAALMCLVKVSNLSVTELRAIWWEVMGGT